MPEKVFCLILHYNQLADTCTCIKKILNSDLPAGVTIAVIDNGTKNLAHYFAQHFPDVIYIRSPRNGGFASGNNMGIRLALKEKSKYIAIINPDVSVRHHFLKPLIRSLRTLPEAGVVVPAHTEGDGVYGLGGFIDWKMLKFTHDSVTVVPIHPREYEHVTFACVVIKDEVLRKVGLLDEKYFMYLEDVDYCVSVARAGYRLFCDPSVIVTHKTSSSYIDPRHKILYSLRSALIFIRKWYRFPQNILPIIHTYLFYPKEYVVWSLRLLKRKIVK